MNIAEIELETKDYEAFQLIEITSFEAFLNAHADIKAIASSVLMLSSKKQSQLNANPIHEAIPLMQSILDQIEDQHCLVFEKEDNIYQELKFLNRSKLVHIELNDIKENRVYILMSDFQRLLAV
ncbi:hypothetical protein CW751_02040 [Brumimicrobium salinarum]|uniref:Uncharacterized protein n=1 Tax=Brumimicrobium salinarum TaxID=2058658 RepID=A0A2I0R6C7_9FLAO|nr:hypothetical protein [Brumimicrobium salinarum]PKR82142.1 hypothetical protein CW751_02040 [Brumimicrobium salinarum]